MKIRLVILLALASCDRTEDKAAKYLRNMRGADENWCKGSSGEAVCLADGRHYRCVVSRTDGCSNNGDHVACELTDVEKPTEVKR